MKRFLLTGILALFAATASYGQMSKVVINELLVYNVDNFEDDYGHRVSWLELFNSGYSTVNVASCYLVIESGGEKISYQIPKNDPRTSIGPQGYLVFFCEGTAEKGTLHTNFTLSLGDHVNGHGIFMQDTLPFSPADREIKLSFLESNGRDTVTSVTYSLAAQKPDVAIGMNKQPDGSYVFEALPTITPLATNDVIEEVPSHEQFRRADPIGYGMAMLAMTVVLVALAMLYLVFRTIGKTMIRNAEKKTAKAAGETVQEVKAAAKDEVFSGDDMAAIALALHLYNNDLNDRESAVLTINRAAKVYSPWSSKLYGLTREPDRNTWRK